ncbi:hypothetical protein ACFY9F_35925 [Streptomyces sp. NPDC012421]|uniref:hypothetical protein n=1 Tax=unclassified Streptomyces TaxID=2593676 RepID=UPI0036CAE801
MSFDVFVCRFENGEAAALDLSVAHEVLGPFVVARDPELGFLQVRTAEGEEAGVYFTGPGDITFNRFGGHGVMELLAVLLHRLDAVLVIPGGPTVIRRDADRELLPLSLRREWPVVVARSGTEIDQAIRGS